MSPQAIRRSVTIAFGLALTSAIAAAGPSEYVNTLRGSNSDPGYSRGNTFPAVTLPFGFNFWTPITDGNSSSWIYTYGHRTIQGFGVCHQPSPWIGDHGGLQVMPMTGSLREAPGDREATFSHADEVARAHYYGVQLGSGIKVELTPTDHASAWRFTFPAAANAYLLFDPVDGVGGSLTVDAAARTISGYVDYNGPRLYVFARIDKPFASNGQAQGGAAAWIGFSTRAGEQVAMTMATSFLGVAQAERNLRDEVGARSFDDVRAAAAAAWDEALGQIEIEGASEDQKTTFYSSLYRAFMYPNSMWETVDGTPRYFSPYDHEVHDGKIYVNNGFWDTYRAAWPLYTLLRPTLAGEMLDGFVNAYKDDGWTPRWSGPGYIDIMVGSHADIIFADAYAKGIAFDHAAAYESMLRNAMTYSGDGSRGRKGNQVSIFKGYIPTDVLHESAAWYLEDRINDFGLSILARGQGQPTEADYFLQRSLDYVNLFSPSVGFFRGRRSDGAWRTSDDEFRPEEWGYEFTEGAPWHYALAANHDPEGMANLYGGRDGMAAKIDAVFAAPRDFLSGSYGGVIHEMLEAYDTDMGQYAHANEPIHHMIYMYNYAGAPAQTQRRVREVMARLYDSGIGTGNGYLGDEDNGEMSSWYVFSALGFYPAAPGQPVYAIGSPLFQRATLRLENGKRFVVSAAGNSSRNVYVQSARLNGAPYTRNYLTHADLLAGGTLELVMGPSPSAWGSGVDDVAPSPTTGRAIPVPMADVAVGGAITVSNDNAAAGEGKEQAFDDDSLTKWLAMEPTATLAYEFSGGRRFTVGMYTLTSADDAPARDPQAWTLEASDDGATWVTLDTRSGEEFRWRRYTKVYGLDNLTPYAHYRLRIDANHGERYTQLAEVELLGTPPLRPTAATGDGAACSAAEDAFRAVDGSTATKWCATGDAPRLEIDLGGACDVNQVLIAHAGAGGEPAERNTRAFRVAVSADGASWTDVATATDNDAAETQHTFETASARFVSLTIDGATQTGESTARIYEVRVYGRCAPVSGADAGPGPGPGDPDATLGGCGCRTGGGAPGAALVVLALVVVRRRR